MADTTHKFIGKVEWLLRRPDKYGKNRMNFYPKDAAERKKIKDLGLRNKINENDSGELFYKFQTGEAGTLPWRVLDQNGAVFEGNIGNGTEVEITLRKETFTSAAHGDVTRSFISDVKLVNLVEYKAPEKTETSKTEELPT